MTNLDQNRVNAYSPEIKDQKFTCVFCWERRDYKVDLCCQLCYKLGNGWGREEVKKINDGI